MPSPEIPIFINTFEPDYPSCTTMKCSEVPEAQIAVTTCSTYSFNQSYKYHLSPPEGSANVSTSCWDALETCKTVGASSDTVVAKSWEK